MMDLFDKSDVEAVIARLDKLTADSQPLWGKMSVGQMLAHCNVTYELDFEKGKHARPGRFMALMLKLFVKKMVTNETPYKKSLRTAPYFLITDEKDFETERGRLVGFLRQVQEMGREAFEGRDSHSFGPLTADEWNTMFAKHLEHHLQQFEV